MLGGGGRQGDAWMSGVLAALEDANGFDLRDCDYFVGTSAGAIVAAKLASGRRLKRPAADAPVVRSASAGRPPAPPRALETVLALAAPLSGLSVRIGKAPGEVLRRAALTALPIATAHPPDFHAAFPPEAARFDGRLRVVAVERASGKRVVFGAPRAPQASVAQALAASCALPLVFAPAIVAGREYVDGAVWSTTNADAAPAGRDAQVLILAPMTSRHGPFAAAVRAAASAATLIEASALKLRGARVRMISPDQRSAASFGPDLMAAANLERTCAAGYAQAISL